MDKTSKRFSKGGNFFWACIVMNYMAQEHTTSQQFKKLEERKEAYPKSVGRGHRSRNCLTVSSLCNPATNHK